MSARPRRPELVFFATDQKGRALSDGYACRSTLAQVMKRAHPSRRYEVRIGRGSAASSVPEIREGRAEPGPGEVVTRSPSSRQREEVGQG